MLDLLDAALAHERSAGAAPLDVEPEALAAAMVLADEEWGDSGSYVERAETILARLAQHRNPRDVDDLLAHEHSAGAAPILLQAIVKEATAHIRLLLDDENEKTFVHYGAEAWLKELPARLASEGTDR